MRRLLTALALLAILGPVVLLLPSPGVLVAALLAVELAAIELVAILRRLQPGPFGALPYLVPCAALAPILLSAIGLETTLALSGTALLLASFLPVLFARTPLEHAPTAAGLIALALPYLALPVYSLFRLHRIDPWVVVLVVALVAAQDSAAFYGGRVFGRRPFAPRVSPKKTWEGAVVGFVAAAAAVVLWCLLRRGGIDGRWVIAGAVAALAGQLGDLCESLLKRGAGIKDSGTLLPGHGGMLDRIDALLFAAPAFLACVGLLGLGRGG